jgi:hypothetical protein
MESSMKKSAAAVLLATVCALVVPASTQSPSITIVTGQSMVRSDLRATKPAALPAMKDC